MVSTVGLNPVPVAIAHDPLGHAMTEEQKARLREQPLPPIEETPAKEKVVERRREGGSSAREHPANEQEPESGPGQHIDSYA